MYQTYKCKLRSFYISKWAMNEWYLTTFLCLVVYSTGDQSQKLTDAKEVFYTSELHPWSALTLDK